MEDTLCSNIDINTYISTCYEDCTILQVFSEKKLDKEWELLEEEDDYILIKNNNNEVLFVKKNKKIN